MNWSCNLLHFPILWTGSGCRKHTELLTKVTVGQTFEQTRLLTTRWTTDGGSEVGDVSLRHLQGHLATAAHRQLRPLAWLTRWGSKATIQVKSVTTYNTVCSSWQEKQWTPSHVCHYIQHRLFIMTGETVNTQSCLSPHTTQTVHHDRRNSEHPVMSVTTYNTDCSSWQEKQWIPSHVCHHIQHRLFIMTGETVNTQSCLSPHTTQTVHHDRRNSEHPVMSVTTYNTDCSSWQEKQWTPSHVCHHIQHRLFIMTGETVNTQSCLSPHTTQTVHHDRRNSEHPVMSVTTYNTDCSSWQEKQWTPSHVCHHIQHRLFIMTGETVNTQSCLSPHTTQTVHHDRRNSEYPVMSVTTYNTDCSSWQEKQKTPRQLYRIIWMDETDHSLFSLYLFPTHLLSLIHFTHQSPPPNPPPPPPPPHLVLQKTAVLQERFHHTELKTNSIKTQQFTSIT